MSNTNTASSGGMGLAGWLFITFLVLKLCNVIDWSWWWVTAPLWGGLVLAAVLGVLALLFVGTAALLASIFPELGKRKRQRDTRKAMEAYGKALTNRRR